jgi:nucleoside-triphosphatase THEP1
LTRAQLVKAVGDMEAAANRIQTSVEKELEKMRGVINTLNSKIKDMEEA